MGIFADMTIDVFVESIFNLPTLAEAYRVAALDLQRKRDGSPVATAGGVDAESTGQPTS